jgi:hypothetical protein
MTAASWQCPNSLCGGVLDRQKSKHIAIDPHTNKEVGSWIDWGWVQVYNSDITMIGGAAGFLLCIGSAIVVQLLYPGNASQSPLANIIVSLGFFAGVVVYLVSVVISAKRRKAALALAVWYRYYRCQRCGRWWLPSNDGDSEASEAEHGRNREERNAG